MSLEIFAGVWLKSPVFWDVMPHGQVSGYISNENTAFILKGKTN
jgi:hypothetical protein